jgi:tape measure domain-containing protein
MAGNATIGALRVALGLDSAQFETGVKRARGSLNEVSKGARSAAAGADELSGALSGLQRGIAALGLAALAREAVQTADAWTNMRSQLRLVSDSTDQAAGAMKSLMGIAQDARTGIGATVDLYSRLARSTDALGASQADVLQVTETISKALTISGTSADQAGGALMQLGQAFASGALRGDELNSVLEGMPRVAQAIAEGMGVTIGQLRAIGAEGKLTADQIFQALLKQSDVIEGEFGQMTTTVGQAVTQLSNTVTEFIGELNEGSAATTALTDVIDELGVQIAAVGDAMGEASEAYRLVIGDSQQLEGATVSLADVVGTASEAVIVLAANVGYVFQQVGAQIGYTYERARAFLELDFSKFDQLGADKRQSDQAARAGIDAFSRSILEGDRSVSNLRPAQLKAQRERLSETRDALSRRKATRQLTDDESAQLAKVKSELRAIDRALAKVRAESGASMGALARGAATARDSSKSAKDAARERAKAERDAERALAALQSQAERTIQSLETESETYLRETQENMLVLREALDAGVISASEYADAIERIWQASVQASDAPLPGDGETFDRAFEEASQAWDETLAANEEATRESLERMGRSFRGFFQEWVGTGKANWQRLLLDMIDDWESTMAALKSLGGKLGDALGSIAGAFGKAAGSFGTTIGQVIGTGLGLGSGNVALDLGLSIGGSALGSLAGSALGSAAASAAGSAALTGASTALATSLGWLSAAAGPIGAIVGLALGSLLKSKPSNQGALATFSGDGYTISGNKRSSETEGAAKAAADAVLQGQALLEAAGIKLLATVTSIDIGVRDRTDILLSDGRALTAAVGDAADAAETALLALLDGAGYVSDAQKSLVESLKAAGKGFDEIAAALNGFAAAQQLGAQFQAAILQMTDPQAFARSQLEVQQSERRSQLQAAADAGYLTAEQLAELNAQLSRLEALELDQVMGRAADDLAGAVDQATNDLRSAYDAQVAAIQAQLDDWKAIGASLESFRRSLTKGSLSGLSLQQQAAAAKALYDRTVAGVRSGDKASLEAFPSVAQAWLEAFRAVAPDSDAYARVLGDVKANTAAAEAYAAMQVSSAEAQLAALETMVEKLIDIDVSIQEGTAAVVAAISRLGTALTAQAAANDNGASAKLPDWFDWRIYDANNPDILAARRAGTALTEFGSDQEALEQHYLRLGIGEIASGARKYANGGGFRVGGFGATDSQLVAFRASPQEFVDIYHGSAIARIDANLNSLGALSTNRAIETRLSQMEGSMRAMERIYRRWDGDGQPPERVV